MKELGGTIAFVTGSSRGLGRAIAGELATRGATPILHASKQTPTSRETLSNLQKISPLSQIYYADIANPSQVQTIVRSIRRDYKRVDILVNNAGITKSSTLLKMTDEQWDSVIQTNLSGVFYVTRAIVPLMGQAKVGRIVNMSSVYGLIGQYGLTNYCASKAGVIGLTKALSKELATRGITVNVVCPGLTDTGMIAAIPQKELASRLQQIPLGRTGTKEEVAQLVAFLCSPAAGYITGQAININGGMF